MEEHLNPLAASHLLQHTLRSLCIQENSQWVYAVFWRILPRNYPPPKWDFQGGAFDRSRGNRRNWILVWEDGFCNFAASTDVEVESGDCAGSSAAYGEFQPLKGLQPELFFKMSHEIYNYGEGVIGKVAADHGHKWVYKEASEQAINFLSAWHNQGDSHPRTWEAQFQCGIKTIALIALREGVLQLGAVHKVLEDPGFVVQVRKKFSYLENIPGVLLPHPSSSGYSTMPNTWPFNTNMTTPATTEYCDQFGQPVKVVTPSMSSLEALLAKLPSVVPTMSPSTSGYCESPHQFLSSQRPLELIGLQKVAKEETDDEYRQGNEMGESSNTMSQYYQMQNQHDYLNLGGSSGRHSKGF